LAVPLPVPQGDAAGQLEASDSEEAVDKPDMNEDAASPGETTVSGADGGMTPRTDEVQLVPAEGEVASGEAVYKSSEGFQMPPPACVQTVGDGGRNHVETALTTLSMRCDYQPDSACAGSKAVPSAREETTSGRGFTTDGDDESTVLDFDEQGLWHYAS